MLQYIFTIYYKVKNILVESFYLLDMDILGT